MFKSLLPFLKEKDFKKSYRYIKENEIEMTNSFSYNILVNMFCVHNVQTVEPIAYEYLVKLVNICNFKDLKETYHNNYVNCIFYIFKYFVDTKNLYLLLKINEDVIIPTFIENVTDLKLKASYKNHCFIFHNALLNEIASTNLKENKFLPLLKLSLKMSQYNNDILYVGQKVIIYLIKYNQSVLIQEYFLHLLAFVKKDINYDKQFQDLLQMLEIICKHYMHKNEIYYIEEIINKAMVVLKQIAYVDEYKLAIQILDEIFHLFNSLSINNLDVNAESIEICINYLKTANYKNSIVIQSALILAALFIEYYYKCENMPENVWIRKMDINVQLKIITLLNELQKILTNLKKKCCCNYFDVDTQFKLLLLVGTMCLNNVSLYDDNQLLFVVKHFNFAFKYLDVMKSKDCKKFKNHWKCTSLLLCNITKKLSNNKNKICQTYAMLFLTKTFQYEGNLSNSSMLLYMLQLHCSTSADFNDFEAVKDMTAFGIYLFPTCTFFYYLWSKAKSELKHPNTILKQLIARETHYKSLYCDFNSSFDLDAKKQLLENELDYYRLKWRSVSVIKEVYLNLYELGDNLATAIAIVKVNIQDNFKITDTLFIIKDLIKSITKIKNADIKTQIVLGWLNYLCYYYKTKETIILNEEDIKTTTFIAPIETKRFGHEFDDPNDACDIVSSYRKLKLDVHTHLFKYMHLSFDYIAKASESASIELLEEFNVFNIIERLAHVYNLHCYTNESINCWIVALKVAKVLKNDVNVLNCISFIIEKLVLNEYALALISEAKTIINKLMLDEINNLHIFTFHVSACFAYLRNGKPDACFASFESATEYYYKLKKLENEYSVRLMMIRFVFVHGLILNIPCNYEILNHDDSSLFQSVIANSKVSSFFSSEIHVILEYALSVYFEITEHLLNSYCCLRQPRYVRCYGKNIVLYAQKTLLTFRTCRLLIYLARADLLSSKYDDCQIKLDGISHMLLLKKSQSVQKSDEAIDKLSDEISKSLQIDCSATAQRKCASSASPVLETDRFSYPSFMTDSSACVCVQCTNVNYQNLVLEKIQLDAMLSYANVNAKASDAFFKIALYIYNFLLVLPKTKKSILPKNVHIYFDNFIDTYVSIILDYNKAILNNSSIKYNTEMYGMLDKVENKNFYLYNEILMQKLLFTSDIEGCTNANTLKKYTKKSQALQLPSDTNAPTTPENKCTTIEFKRSVSPRPHNLADGRFLKPIPFNLDEKSPNTSFVIYTPSTNAMAASTSSSAAKSVRKKIDFTPNKLTKKDDTKGVAKKGFRPQLASTFIETPNATINTRKLTDKLKRTAGKLPDGLKSNDAENVKKKTVRKKLLTEVPNQKVTRSKIVLQDDSNTMEPANDRSTGAIRRTRRVVK